MLVPSPVNRGPVDLILVYALLFPSTPLPCLLCDLWHIGGRHTVRSRSPIVCEAAETMSEAVGRPKTAGVCLGRRVDWLGRSVCETRPGPPPFSLSSLSRSFSTTLSFLALAPIYLPVSLSFPTCLLASIHLFLVSIIHPTCFPLSHFSPSLRVSLLLSEFSYPSSPFLTPYLLTFLPFSLFPSLSPSLPA